MAHGIKCWNSSGEVTLDTSYRLGRVIGEIDVTPGVPGSASISMPVGDPFALVAMEEYGAGYDFQFIFQTVMPGYSDPKVSITNTSIQWSFAYADILAESIKIYYGVY